MRIKVPIKKYAFLIIIGTILFSSCNIIKTVKLLKQGSVSVPRFKEEIPFELRAGIIVIKVEIEGKVYDFIFDSGATNAVSLELSKKLDLKTVSQQESVDFEGKTETIGFAELKKISIGKISFNNTAAAIIDLKKVPEINCLKVDGLIGGNLMRKAVWHIDYKNQKIIFADNIDSLNVPANTPFVAFTPLISGTPVFKADINGMVSNKIIFDTGSSGDLMLLKKDLEKLNEKDKTLKQVRGVGSNSSGLYGRKLDTTYVAKIPLVKIGGLEITNQIAEFKKTDLGNCGSGFLKNYLVTFDWKNSKAWFQNPSPEEKNDWASFGFVPIVKDGKMFVSYLYENSPAELNGIRLNDQVLFVNSVDYNLISDDAYCDMVVNKFLWKNTETLSLIIRSENKEERKITITRKDLFDN